MASWLIARSTGSVRRLHVDGCLCQQCGSSRSIPLLGTPSSGQINWGTFCSLKPWGHADSIHIGWTFRCLPGWGPFILECGLSSPPCSAHWLGSRDLSHPALHSMCLWPASAPIQSLPSEAANTAVWLLHTPRQGLSKHWKVLLP